MHDPSTHKTSLSAWSTIKLPADVQIRLPMHLIYFWTWIKLIPCLTCVRQIEACNVIHCKGVWHIISYHICHKLLLVCTTSKLCIHSRFPMSQPPPVSRWRSTRIIDRHVVPKAQTQCLRVLDLHCLFGMCLVRTYVLPEYGVQLPYSRSRGSG